MRNLPTGWFDLTSSQGALETLPVSNDQRKLELAEINSWRLANSSYEIYNYEGLRKYMRIERKSVFVQG